MIIGLTGGIGSGKSMVSLTLKELGCYIVDGDKMSRDVQQKGSKLVYELAEAFGDSIITEDGELIRKALGAIAFSSEENTAKLNRIMSKAMNKRFHELLDEGIASGRIVILDIPMLFESGWDKYADENWVVVCPEDIRIRRVIERDGIDRQQVLDRISKQMSDEARVARADIVINNTGSMEDLERIVTDLINERSR